MEVGPRTLSTPFSPHGSASSYISRKSTGSNRGSLIDFWEVKTEHICYDIGEWNLYPLSMDKKCMTYLSFNPTPGISGGDR